MMSRSLIAAPVLILAWLAAQLWVYLPTYSSAADAAFITKLMVEEIAILACWISAWSWVTWQEQGQTRLAELNLPLFDVPLSHFIMRPSIAVPRPSVFQTASD